MINQNKQIIISSARRTRVETTYEYVPIIGDIIGYWRKEDVMQAGESIELAVNTPIGLYDRIFINGLDVTKAVKDSIKAKSERP